MFPYVVYFWTRLHQLTYVDVWEALLTFHLSNHLTYTHPLLMSVTCGAVFLLSIFCLMADKFCCVFCYVYIGFVTCEPTVPCVEWAVKTLLQIHIPVFLSQSHVAAGVKSFDPNILRPNNSYFYDVYSWRSRCVTALKSSRDFSPVHTGSAVWRCFLSAVMITQWASSSQTRRELGHQVC